MGVKRNPELEALFARLPLLDRGELLALAGARQPDDPDRETAWASVRDAITASHTERELEQIRSEVGAWATHLGAITGQEAGSGMSDLLMADARRAAATAVLDAAVALLLGARLSERDRAALVRPWEDVVGG